MTRPTAAYRAARGHLTAVNAVRQQGPAAIAAASDDQDAVRRAVLALADHTAAAVADGLDSYCTRASARTGDTT